jgi:GDP-4-dehydro-6-deoxy-D-mannose reductase
VANITHLLGTLTLFEADLKEPEPLARILAEVKPDLVFHLAGQAFVPLSWSDPAGTLTDNILGQANLFQGLLRAGINPPTLIPGSNEEYGLILPEEVPVRESNPLRPTSPYAVSKIAQDMLAYQYFLSHQLHCVRMRPFNHIGPRQNPNFVVASFAKQVAEAEAGLGPPQVRVGNLEAQRDFTDVRDVVRAYYLALLRGEPGEVYNLGSGQAVRVKDILDFFLARSRVPLQVVQEPARLRPLDVALSVCDPTKFRAQTGWEPEIPLKQTLEDTLDYWRGVLTSRGPQSERPHGSPTG